MKKKTEKKLSLSKIKIGTLTQSNVDEAGISGKFCVSVVIACISQGAPICSEDSCRF